MKKFIILLVVLSSCARIKEPPRIVQTDIRELRKYGEFVASGERWEKDTIRCYVIFVDSLEILTEVRVSSAVERYLSTKTRRDKQDKWEWETYTTPPPSSLEED